MGASSQSSFCLLTQGPPEILHEILSYCQQNDLVCLSLASHLFRDLTRPLIPAKPSLVSCDESLTEEPRLAAREACAEPWYCPRYPPGHRICHRKWCSHCECITCPLYKRLREWAGDLKYCTICSKFTKRETTKKYKGRCLHGRPKTRKAPNNHWTAKKGQSYGYRWWRRWGTSGVDSWAYDEKPRTPGQMINARVV
ncbi:F-box domain-containing protein [Colletotrichum asianum]|uniref:F-box domain-containing protein n=1 Tax=Colletotrichum asianum TaxID=702518 RepID=A0A8H3W3D7_9PEZI|nr:F-box domain-containing protein [Colletotrichum asianum]